VLDESAIAVGETFALDELGVIREQLADAFVSRQGGVFQVEEPATEIVRSEHASRGEDDRAAEVLQKILEDLSTLGEEELEWSIEGSSR